MKHLTCTYDRPIRRVDPGQVKYAEEARIEPIPRRPSISFPDQYRRAADYVARILRGAKPSELSIQQPVKFALTVNLKTAKALGLEIPQSSLVRADQIIE